jgi:hypothetical protein
LTEGLRERTPAMPGESGISTLVEDADAARELVAR